MTVTLMAKSWPGTGRPDDFEVVKENDPKRVEYLRDSWGYYVVALKPRGYTRADAWEEYTVQDDDGFAQWRQQ